MVCDVWLLAYFHACSVVFLITQPPIRNKQLIRPEQGLWLVINDCLKESFFIAFNVCVNPSSNFTLIKKNLWKANCDSADFLLLRESVPSRPLQSHTNALMDRQLSLFYSPSRPQTHKKRKQNEKDFDGESDGRRRREGLDKRAEYQLEKET